MILKSLRLQNIRSYADERFNFSEGRTLLSGDIGSGKSTVLLAIEFALFGIQRADVSGASLLRHGKARAEVELTMMVEGKEIKIIRTLKRTKGNVAQDSGYIIVDGRKTEGTPVELKAMIIDILGYPKDILTRSKSVIYRYTVYTPQEEMKEILRESPDTRKEVLRKVFGVDKYKEIEENSRNYCRDIKKTAADLRQQAEPLGEKRSSLSGLDTLLSESISLQNELRTSHDLREKEVKAEKEKLKLLDEKAKELLKIESRLEMLEKQLEERRSSSERRAIQISASTGKIETAEEKLASYETIGQAVNEEELSVEQRTYETRLSDMQKKKAVLQERLVNATSQITTLEREIQSLSHISKELIVKRLQADDLRTTLEEMDAFSKQLLEDEKRLELVKLKTREKSLGISSSKKLISELQGMKKCPHCLQEMDEDHRREMIGKNQEIISAAEDAIRKLDATQRVVEKSIQAGRQRIEQLRKSQNDLSRLDAEIASMQKEVIGMEEKHKLQSKLENERKTLTQAISELPDEAGLKKRISELAEALREARLKNKLFHEKQLLLSSVENERQNLAKLTKEEEEARPQIAKLEKEIDETIPCLRQSEDLKAEIRAMKEKIDNMSEEARQAELKLAGEKSRHAYLEKEKQRISKEISALEALEKKAEHITEIRCWLEEFFIPLMSSMEKNILGSVHADFSAAFREWFSMLVDGIDVSLDESFTVKVFQDGYETEYESLSGGEKTSVALAYRLALNKVINDMIAKIRTKSMIILDEPTDGFSSEQLDKVRDVFDKLDMKQVILVSHEAKIESFADRTVRIIKTEEGSVISA